MLLTIDASVWVSSTLPNESSHESSQVFINRVITGNTKIVVPVTLRIEISAALGRAGLVSMADALLQKMDSLGAVRWIDVDAAVADRDAKIAANNRLLAGDSIYAAVAEDYGCTLVSLDEDHLKRLAGVVVAVKPGPKVEL